LVNYEGIIKQRLDLVEQFHTYHLIDEMVPFNFIDDPGVNTSLNLQDTISEKKKKFVTMLGLIPTKNLLKFEKLLFRISRGNAVSKTKSLPIFDDSLLEG